MMRFGLLVLSAIIVVTTLVFSGQGTIAVTEADVKVTSVTVTAPADADTNVAFDVTATAVLHNNGPTTPVNADTTFTLSLPGDCATNSANPVTAENTALLVSVDTPTAIVSWTITCAMRSTHPFTVDVIAVVDQLDVIDSTPANNTGQGQDSTAVFDQADVKITAQDIPHPWLRRGLVGQNFTIEINKTLHNNGPTSPVDVSLAPIVLAPVDCVVTPDPANPTSATLALSVATPITEKFTVNCGTGGAHSIAVTNSINISTLHVKDPTPADAIVFVQLDIDVKVPTSHQVGNPWVDSDGDGVADADEGPCGGAALDPNKVPERVDNRLFNDDEDQDGAVDEALPGGSTGFDCDGDGFIGSTEVWVYATANTVPDQDPCGSHAGAANPPLPIGWPHDLVGGFFSGNKVNIQDITTFLAPVKYFNSDVGDHPPGDVRWDLLPGKTVPFSKDISIVELTSYLAGPSAHPPMLGGARAFAGPGCPWAP